MKKVIAGILAVLCVTGSLNMNIAKSGSSSTRGSSNVMTAYAATTVEVPDPSKNSDSYKYAYADTSRYVTKFTQVKITPDPDDTKKVYEWKSEDNKYTYGIYRVDVSLIGEKEPEFSEYVVGIAAANENVIDVDLSEGLEIDNNVFAFVQNNSIDIDWTVSYLAPKVFANSYLKTIKLDGVKYIDKNVFEKCQYITDMEIPSSVLYVGSDVFANSGLKTLAVKNEMPVIPSNMCLGTKLTKIDFDYPELIHTIGSGAFQGSSVAAPLFMTSYGSDVSGYEPLVVGEKAYADCTFIQNIEIPDNVVTLGIGSFSGCSSISSLRCGKMLLGIDKEAFKGCTALSDITFNDILLALGGGAFQGCTALKNVSGIPETIGDWVVTDDKTGAGYGLGDGVFSNCTNLVQCDLPEAITMIPKSTFENCSSLTTVGFNSGSAGENLKAIGPSAFANCTSMLEAKFDNVTIIGPSAYSGCIKLQEADFPKAVYIGGTKDTTNNDIDSIISKEFNLSENTMLGGGSTFLGCTELRSVNIPASRYIFPSSFKDCTSMTSFKAGNCEIVGNNALEGCTAMTEITLLSKQYGNAAPTKSNKKNGFTFLNCTSAEKITIDAKFLVDFPNKTPNGFFSGCESLKTIDTKNGDFSKVTVVSNSTFSGCSSIEELDLESVIIVEDDVFSNCTSLKKISSSVNSLHAEDYGKNSFLNCSELKFTITGAISTIGDSAFKNSGITAVDLKGMQGGTVVIGSNAFAGCNNLTSAKILSDSAAKFSIGSGVFADCPILKDVVYEGQIITERMFKNCPDLIYVTTNAKSIKANAFDGDTQFKMLKDINSSSKSIIADEINAYAFRDCTALEVIPADSHTVLSGVNIFTNCINIKDADVGTLTAGIFSGCKSLSNVKLTGVPEVPKNAFTDCLSLKEIDISEMVNIGANAFDGSGITSVKLNNAQTIAASAFANCSSLKSIDVVASTISSKAFYKSEFLEDAVLNVDKVQNSAFEGCASLRNVTFQSSGSHSLTELGSNAFNDCNVLYELILQGDPKMSSRCVGFVSKKVNGDFILVGKTGSTVEAYANSNKIAFCDIDEFDLDARKLARNVPGDVDGNAIVSVADAVKLQSWLLNKPTPGIIGANMDVNGDGRVDSFDMIAMRKKLTKK